MKKIVVLLGSPRKKDGYAVCQILEEKMKRKGEVSFEYIHVSHLNIQECKGCELCLIKGENFCPLEDDLNSVRQKLQKADGIIFNSPVYACHITGSLKKTVDRLSYLFHRPELIGKPALTLVTTAGGGIKDTKKYLKMIAVGWGCYFIGSIEVVASQFFEKRWVSSFFSPGYVTKMNKELEQKAESFYEAMESDYLPVPKLYDIYMFSGLKSKTYTSKADYTYWKDRGWLEAAYYYKTPMGPLKRLFGWMMDELIKSIGGRMQAKEG